MLPSALGTFLLVLAQDATPGQLTNDEKIATVVVVLVIAGIAIIWFLIPCLLCASFTRERGHGGAIGFVLGILFGWIAVLFCALMPYKQYGRGYDPGARHRRARRRTRRG
ncbi:MAG: hypothetical protein H6837_08245 [Planctomycetes bacterium]|nr:hypothetical protein [Planctomycetota bacterium]